MIFQYGYADPSQDARGMHSRQFARTFIFGDVTDASKRVVIVVAEITMSTQALRDEVTGSGGLTNQKPPTYKILTIKYILRTRGTGG